jgi:hypothetical protein
MTLTGDFASIVRPEGVQKSWRMCMRWRIASILPLFEALRA